MHKSATALFARPANVTQYTVGDIVANSAVAGTVVIPTLHVSGIPGKGGRLLHVLLSKSSVVLTDAAFSVLFFTSLPTVTSGDNAALAVAGNAAGYIGKVDITMAAAFTDGAYGEAAADLPFQLPAGGRDLYAVVVAADTYTPVSAETFTVAIGVERD